jgi:hypothetical protein
MQQTIYYLVDSNSGHRIQWYRTLTGARIAQRLRNRRLGFDQRIERLEWADNQSVEQYWVNDQVVTAPLIIIEDTVDVNDVYDAEG